MKFTPTTAFLMGQIMLIAISSLVIAMKVNDTTVSRDFNNDGKVDIVDLSIMSTEIATRNAQK